MANVKLSQIAAGTTPASTDTVVGVQGGTTDAQYTLAQIGASLGSRTRLLANTDYYISHDTGNDANNGSIGSPWATHQHAINVISQTLDIAGFTITLHVADSASTYAGVSWTEFIGGGQIVFLGNNTTLGNVKIGNGVDAFGNPTGAFNSGGGNVGTLIWVSGYQMLPTNGPCLDCDGTVNGYIILGEPTFLITTRNQFSSCQANSYVVIGNVIDETTGVSIIDGTAISAQTPQGFYVLSNPAPFSAFFFLTDYTITGTLVVSRAFAVVHADGLNMTGSIAGGAVTGKKFEIDLGGVLFTDSFTSLPGSLPGNNQGRLTFGSPPTTYLGSTVLFNQNLPSLYTVLNASGNNWFEGNAGNFAVTGFQNFGTGDRCLASLTSGYQNTGIGATALQHCTSGFTNFAVGTGAMLFTQTDQNNVGIGFNALATVGIGGAGGGNNANNVAIGFGAGGNFTDGGSNVAIGSAVLANVTGSMNFNTVIGNAAGNNFSGTGVNYNTLIGYRCAGNLTGGQSNTWLGGYQGTAATYNNTIVISDSAPGTAEIFDYGLTSVATSVGFSAWSFSYDFHYLQPVVMHLYNVQDALGVATNYERAAFDWFVTPNVFRIRSQAGGTGTVRMIAIDGFSKAGAPANTDLPSGTWGLIDDTTNNQTWLVFNKGGTIRKVQLT